MPLPAVSFLVGLAVVLYLSTFILFALLRIITGVSVQRVGYTGFRRIAFFPRDGIKVHIRGISLSVHRPTFAQPTWLSLNLTELQIFVDLRALNANKRKGSQDTEKQNGCKVTPASSNGGPETNADNDDTHGRTWKKLTKIKETVKRLHRKIKWIRLVDLVATGSTVVIRDVGTVRVERFNLSVDTRVQTVDRSRLFQHQMTKVESQTPAEWKSIVRSILFTPEGKESTEILDYCTFNVHGFLHKELDGLRDASIAWKLGRLTVPYDDLDSAIERVRDIRNTVSVDVSYAGAPKISINDVFQQDEDPDSRDENIMQTISDSKEFASSILRGIQEIQLAVGFFGLSKRIKALHTSGQHVYFNLAMKEVGFDLLRLDSRSPAHRMYFSPKDVAHQALLTAISIAAGVDDGHEHPERMLYVPMVTATVKTTLPSKTVQYVEDAVAHDRNTNILFANFVCTSPSVDLDPKHLPLLLAILQSQRTPRKQGQVKAWHRRDLVSRLLPKASVKLSIQEPVVRVSLPPMDASRAGEGDYDLLISSTSTMAWEIEASHATEGQSHYGLVLNYRQTSQRLYYQASTNEKHDLLDMDTVEVKVEASTLPETNVLISGKFQTFSAFLVRPDICEGVRQIMKSVRKDPFFSSRKKSGKKPSFLRQMPSWLQHCQLQGSDFNLEIAGVDDKVSKYSRGFALHLESWSAEYKAHREEVFETAFRRRSVSRPPPKERPEPAPLSGSPRSKKLYTVADGRRLAIHIEGLEGLIIDSLDSTGADPFMALPRFEVAFSTSTDQQGPIFHINSHAKSFMVNYSLYNHFSIGVASTVIKRTFIPHSEDGPEQKQHHPSLSISQDDGTGEDPLAANEITTVDFKASLIQLKAQMPADPPLMIQVFGLDAGQHRWATPFLRVRLARLYAASPRMQRVWSRIVSAKSLRVDLREIKRKSGKTIVAEKSIDVGSEAIRFVVPHQLVVHDIFDNITTAVKTAQQLHHHFYTGSANFNATKEPEPPKHVPKINLRCQVLMFEIEDSSFEWKLSTIYRSGLIEQKQRLAREEAFRLKVKKLDQQGQRRGSSRARPQSAHPRERSPTRSGNIGKKRSKIFHHRDHHDSSNDGPTSRHRHMRYDTEGACDMSQTCHRSVEDAREKLMRYNAQTWKKRIDGALETQKHAMRDMRALFWGLDEVPEDIEQTEQILATNQRPALMACLISDLSIVVGKPSFPLAEYPKFLHDIGKGMPYDMKYSLLVPMNLQVSMGEARIALRDYPLPLLHVPAIRSGQSPRLPSLSLRTDFVIAEEFRDEQSQRRVNVVVIPKEKMSEDGSVKPFSVEVRRTISPVKTYTNMKVEINTSQPTKITWGTSYQPAIQDMMQVIEGFTKPPLDPSERVGFWDKIRLSFHSRINVSWKGDGDVHLILKGSRDPYVVTGNGAGFVMVWRNNVSWNIAQDHDPRRFMTVNSGDYILAIPDFNHYVRYVADASLGDGASSTTGSAQFTTALFKKVVMKLSGNVQWLAGLVFERDTQGNRRTFDFCPHYEVVLKHPSFAKAPAGEVYDAFRNFRSHHIHMSIAIAAPQDRDWSVSNFKPSNNYNSVHLTPRFFTHFYSWWSLFSGVMSLPVRQGPLWASQEKSSKKFGRHLATIKYNLLLSPLFISHIYKHKEAEDYQSDVVSATGLKMKLDSFMLDLHQRRETFETQPHAGAGKPKKTSGMRINQSQLDFINADIRAVSSTITGTNSKDVDNATEEDLASYQESSSKVDMARFTIPDNDFSWIDMDDFVELDWILPAESNPETKILPLGTAPRFTYFRQTDHGDSVHGDKTRSSPFGDEPTHYCVMTARNDPRQVQADLIKARLNKIQEQIENNERAVGEHELKVVRDASGDPNLAERLEVLRNHTEALQKKQEFLSRMLRTLLQRLAQDDPAAVPDLETPEEFYDSHERRDRRRQSEGGIDSAPLADYSSDFNNRFVVHNAQIKWNNSLRNIILRYMHQVSQRRGFVYYMSRRAVKFILDILDEQRKSHSGTDISPNEEMAEATTPLSPGREDETTIQDRIEQLLQDGRSFVNADDPDPGDYRSTRNRSVATDAEDDIAFEFTPQNTYHFRLIAPQIQLQSEKNQKSAVLVTAKGMQLKVVQIMDKDRVVDEISGLVQRRFTAAMDSLQMFVTSTRTFSTDYLHMYSGNRYGTKAGAYWPPWVPLEVMFEFQVNPYGFSRIVQRTSASLRYDKYNTLRLKYNNDVSGGEGGRSHVSSTAENRMDHLWIEFPQLRAICDSAQYYALYIIVMDLLLYNEPLEKTRSERLEKIMLASDFSDLTGAPEMVQMLQERIHQLEEIKMYFQVNEKYLDRQGWKDRIAMDQDLANCEDELFFMMKAITTSQRRIEDRVQREDSSTGLLRWLISAKEIAWHLIREKNESLLEFQIRDGLFDRTDYNDGSNYNCVNIGRVNGFNLLPNAIYPEIIAPYVDPGKGFNELHETKMLRVHWLMLEAIAGIPVVDYFEVDLVPLRVQLEREVAKRLFEYIFPGVGGNAFEGSGFSPFMIRNMLPTQEEEDESGEQKDGEDQSAASTTTLAASSNKEHGMGTGAGTLEHRLTPTMALAEPRGMKRQKTGLGITNGSHSNLHHWSLLQHSNKAHPGIGRRLGGNMNSQQSLSVMSRTPSERSVAKSDSTNSHADNEKGKRGVRPGSGDKKKEKERSDDLTQMMSRASNYMTLSYVKIPSMVLCLSYKGRGQRNLEDVHDLVFRMPTLEYRNKTWSNLDLALQLKKDVIKALISHAGAIVGNKFKHQRSSKPQHNSRLREIINMSTIMSSSGEPSTAPSEESSLAEDMFDEPRQSFTSGRGSTLSRSVSFASGTSIAASMLPPPESEGTLVSHSGTPPPSRGSTKQHLQPPQQLNGEQEQRNRGSSISRHLTGLGQRLRQGTDGAPAEEAEESAKKKSKLLLGGQKLLRSLPHP